MEGCHCLGTRDWYLMHYSNPVVTGGQKHTDTHIFALRLMRMFQEAHRLFNMAPNDTPKESQYLLELNYSTLYNTPYERQAHWVLAMQAVWQAGRRTASWEREQGGLQQRRAAKLAS
jgi:hypothetical protein